VKTIKLLDDIASNNSTLWNLSTSTGAISSKLGYKNIHICISQSVLKNRSSEKNSLQLFAKLQ
jgi:hypothetical protein